MSTENAKIQIRNRSVEIKWITQNCDHIMNNFINYHADHDLTFQQISNMLRKCRLVQERGKVWHGLGVYNNVKYRVVFLLEGKFAIIKTCYRHGWKN